MSRAAVSCPAARLSAFYAATFLVTGIQLPFWPGWLSSRGFDAREIGILLAAGICAKVVATPAIGAIADRTAEPSCADGRARGDRCSGLCGALV
jgi:MFS family permease